MVLTVVLAPALIYWMYAMYRGWPFRRRLTISVAALAPPRLSSRVSSSQVSSYFSSTGRQRWADGFVEPGDLQILTDGQGHPMKLGQGVSGEVFRGFHRGVHPVALKVLRNVAPTESQQTGIVKEIAVLRACRHPHVVQFQGVSFIHDTVILVMEYMSGGDLLNGIQSSDTFRWYKRGAQVAYDIISGLAYLHAHNLIHLDVKSPNVLLTKYGRAKLGDVGLATWLTAFQTHASLPGCQGTFAYMAPEVLIDGKAAPSSDIYSFGIVLWEIVTGGVPKRGCLRPARVPQECPQEVADVIERCTTADPKERPTAKDLMGFMANYLGISLEEELSPATSCTEPDVCPEGSARQFMEVHLQHCEGALHSSNSLTGTQGRSLETQGRFLNALSSIVSPLNYTQEELDGFASTSGTPLTDMKSPFQDLAETGFAS
eukprot:jgi/Botrbrau1/15301/Bobra.0096s0004.1